MSLLPWLLSPNIATLQKVSAVVLQLCAAAALPQAPLETDSDRDALRKLLGDGHRITWVVADQRYAEFIPAWASSFRMLEPDMKALVFSLDAVADAVRHHSGVS